jgi:hypothetical protein
VALSFLLFSNVTLFSEPVDNFIRFVNRDLPIERIVYSLDGKLFSFRGVQAQEPVRFEAAFQSNTFYIKPLTAVTSGGVVVEVPTNSAVYGKSSDGSAWMVDDNVKVITESWMGQSAQLSPVEVHVDWQRELAGNVLGLGLPNGLERLVRAGPNQLVATTKAGEAVPIAIVMDSSNRVSTVEYEFLRGEFSAKCRVRYRYEDGDRPAWLPQSFERTVRGVRNGKPVSVATKTNLIEFCHLGTVAEFPNDGYTPEPFLIRDELNPTSRRTMFYSNGAAYVLDIARDGTSNIEEVLAEVQHNPLHVVDPLHADDSRARRGVVVVVLLGVVLVGALILAISLLRSTKQ